jgi:hypothetical protein
MHAFFVLSSRPACVYMCGTCLMLLGELPSSHDLSPLDQGGPVARAGFLYQDHVGAGFCIEMLRNTKLTGVWCETLDDITLIWDDGGRPRRDRVKRLGSRYRSDPTHDEEPGGAGGES